MIYGRCIQKKRENLGFKKKMIGSKPLCNAVFGFFVAAETMVFDLGVKAVDFPHLSFGD